MDATLSRIWNAVRQAERERGRGVHSRSPGQPAADSSNRRRSKRSKPPVSLLVYGVDADKHPFHEEADIFDANEGGCLISLETPVVRGQRLVLVNLTNQDERECRVVRLGKLQCGKTEAAVEFLRPAPEFWFET
jgi:hypothetical protein